VGRGEPHTGLAVRNAKEEVDMNEERRPVEEIAVRDLEQGLWYARARARRARDVFAPHPALGASWMEGKPVILLAEDEEESYDPPRQLDPTAHALAQMDRWLGIPGTFAERLRREAPRLWVEIFNTLVGVVRPRRLLLRMLGPERDGAPWVLRAVVSQRFERLDDDEVLAALESALKGVEVLSTEVVFTSSRTVVRVLFGETREAGLDDVAQPGLVVVNSEVGRGGFAVRPYVVRTGSKGGMVVPGRQSSDRALRVGAQGPPGSLSRGTRRCPELDLDPTGLPRHIARALDPDGFGRFARVAGEAARRPMPALETTVRRLRHVARLGAAGAETLAREAPATMWELAAAVAAMAGGQDDPERRLELEVTAGRIVADRVFRERLGEA